MRALLQSEDRALWCRFAPPRTQQWRAEFAKGFVRPCPSNNIGTADAQPYFCAPGPSRDCLPDLGCGLYCGWIPTVQTIQIVMDAKLLKAADSAAKRRKVNRSEFIRLALKEHLARERAAVLAERDRRGYEALPQKVEEYAPWEDNAAWPED